MSQGKAGVKIEDDEQTLIVKFNLLLKGEKSITKVIDPDGDILLQLPEAKLQVSSKVLSLASPVWKKMFSSKLSEGNPIHKGEQPRCIPHLEKDTKTMTTLCIVLHHKGHEIAKQPCINELVQLAVLADNYDCAEAIAYYGCSILSGLTRAMGTTGLPNDQLLFPAILFDDHYTFERVTRMMVYTKTPADQVAIKRYNITTWEIRDLLPEGLLEFLSAKEQTIKAELPENIEKLIQASTDFLVDRVKQSQLDWQTLRAEDRDPKAGCNCLRVSVPTKNLTDLGVLPISTAMTTLRLGDVCEKLSRLSLFGYTAALPEFPPSHLRVTPIIPDTPAVPANKPAAPTNIPAVPAHRVSGQPYKTSAPLHLFAKRDFTGK